MFQKILVPMDMSEMGEAVFNKALSLAMIHQSDLLLLHVLSSEENESPLPIPPDLPQLYPAQGNDLTLEVWREQWEEFEHRGIETLDKRCQKGQQAGLKVSYQQILGSPGRTICQVAKKEGIELIVIGHRGLSGIGELLLGSVSNYVFHHATCSVLIVNQSENK
ncbi:MAG: universal stress protein [Microcystaceae cyanobacterium]